MGDSKMWIRAQRYVERVYLDDLHEHEANPNVGDTDVVRDSISELGFYGAVLAQEGTGVILAGHTRVRAARAEGGVSLPVLYIEVDDEELDDLRILLADNRTAELAERDPSILAANFSTLLAESDRGIAGTGYDQEAVDVMLGRIEPLPPVPDDPPPPVEEGHTEYRCPSCGHEWAGSPRPSQ